jgi:hypothetical protein
MAWRGETRRGYLRCLLSLAAFVLAHPRPPPYLKHSQRLYVWQTNVSAGQVKVVHNVTRYVCAKLDGHNSMHVRLPMARLLRGFTSESRARSVGGRLELERVTQPRIPNVSEVYLTYLVLDPAVFQPMVQLR